MIRKLDYKDKNLIEKIPSDSVNAVKIKSLFKAYGMGYNFLSFYADDFGDIVVAMQDNFATIYLADKSRIFEASIFLSLLSNSIISEYPLNLDDYIMENVGKNYALNIGNFKGKLLLDVSNEIQTAFDVLTCVFPDSFNSVTYNKWYTEVSHRIRHGVSKIYSVAGKATVTVYGKSDDVMTIVQLGTVEEFRRQGLAVQLLGHIIADNYGVKKIVLQSQNEKSDLFYDRIGFEQVGEWYYYYKK